MDASYLQYYSSGIFNDPRCSSSFGALNHALNVVGYTPDYLIVRNSSDESGWIWELNVEVIFAVFHASYPIWSKYIYIF